MYLRAIAISPKSERDGADWNRLCMNVAFLATQALKPLKIDLGGVSTIVVRFADEDRNWDGVVRIGIAEIMVRFDPGALDRSRPIESQKVILESLLGGLRTLSGPHRLSESQLAALESSAVDSAFSTEISLTPSVAIKTPEGQLRAEAVMQTGFDHCRVLLRLSLKRQKVDLTAFETWFSASSTYRSVLKLSLLSSHSLVLTCERPEDEFIDKVVFDRTCYDLSNAPVPAQVVTVKEEIRFRYPVTALRHHVFLAE